jgi:hypothetical protein
MCWQSVRKLGILETGWKIGGRASPVLSWQTGRRKKDRSHPFPFCVFCVICGQIPFFLLRVVASVCGKTFPFLQLALVHPFAEPVEDPARVIAWEHLAAFPVQST